MKSYALLFLWFLILPCSAQQLLNNVAEAFNHIAATPQTISFSCKGIKIPAGGHLQGVQLYRHNKQDKVVLTASSSTYAYAIKTGLRAAPAMVHKLMDNPYRHAGGCQLTGNLLAVGIEDNVSKDKSKVVLFNVDDTLAPKIITERKGQFKRSTAGATGILQLQSGSLLVAVADWDARNIDYYKSDNAGGFDSVGTFSAAVTASWCSYQNINLVGDTAGNVFIIGLGRDATGNRADLYSMDLKTYNLHLLSTRYFNCNRGCSFRFGAGIRVMSPASLIIYACPRLPHDKLPVNAFLAPVDSN